jgi:hypothetical protein
MSNERKTSETTKIFRQHAIATQCRGGASYVYYQNASLSKNYIVQSCVCPAAHLPCQFDQCRNRCYKGPDTFMTLVGPNKNGSYLCCAS